MVSHLLLQMCEWFQEHVKDSLSDGRFALDINSEARRRGLIQHFSHFSLSVHTSMVLQVQLAAELTNGLLSPRLQLFSLTPTLDVCLEHHSNPAQCFTKFTSLAATSSSYVDEASYQQQWMPVLSLEAAETAVGSQASAIIHNVNIEWRQEQVEGKGEESGVVGKFSLSQSFCKERGIVFTGYSESPDNLGVYGLEQSMPAPLDFLCVRYMGLDMEVESGLDERVLAMVKTGAATGSWVGHCVVLKIRQDKRGMVKVRVRLQSSSVNLPPMLLDSSFTSQLPCTVEWIPKTPLFRLVVVFTMNELFLLHDFRAPINT